MSMPTDEQVVLAASLRLLSADCGVPEVVLVKRLLELSRDAEALARWPVRLGRVARLAEQRRVARSQPLGWRG